jgi:phage terminase small subunit
MSKGKKARPRAAKGCAGVTLSGGQCSRRAVEGSTFCRQHAEGSGKLTEKQLRFIDEYLIDLNGAGAARRSGYSEGSARVIAAQNLSKLNIREAIEKRLAELAMGKAEVLRRLADQARGSLEPFIVEDVSRPGRVRLDLSTEDARLAIGTVKKVKIKTLFVGKGARQETVEVELIDSQAALIHLGKAHALFVDRQEVSGPEGGPVETVTTLDVSKLSDAALAELDEMLAGE